MMSNKSTITLSVSLPDFKTHRVCIDTTLFKMFQERAIEELKMGLLPGSFGDAVEMIESREFRRDLLKDVAVQLAEQLADYLEDSEGWHGERRREIIKAKPPQS